MIDLTLKDLPQFRGTERYYEVMGANITDGVKYIMDNGYGWVVTDAIVICQMKLKRHPFIAISLRVKHNKATIEYTDGNYKVLFKQEYEYTNAKEDLTLFFIDNVMLLSGEY